MRDTITCPDCLTEQVSDFNIKPNDKRIFKGKCIKCHSIIRFKLNNQNENGLLETDSITFTINGVVHTVQNEYAFSTSLNEYLRSVLNMTGTKVVCKEGGCGSCVVNAEILDYETNQYVNTPVNSCLFPLYSCNNIKFTTVEGVGGKKAGFNTIQHRIVENNASQCGFCTPGMVMNMYNLLLNNPKPSKQEIEDSLDGNICRCTGYRAILNAYQSFASDQKPIDIEELYKLKCLNGANQKLALSKKKIHIIKDSLEWYYPKSITDLFDLLKQYQSSAYKIVSGSTGNGVFKTEGPFSVYIDVKNIPDMYDILRGEYLTVGAMTSIQKLIDVCNEFSRNYGFEYLSGITGHLSKIANRHIRSVGTWAGNLMLKYSHKEFPSDLFITLETVNAAILAIGPFNQPESFTPSQLLSAPMNGKILYSVTFPPYDKEKTFIRTYKISVRSQNSHAYVNAGFRFSFDPTNLNIESATIVYGGINANFIHASNTENFLVGKNISDQAVLQQALSLLSAEIVPDNDPVAADPEYRKMLASSLFYKFILYVNKNKLTPRLASGIDSIVDNRVISSGIETYSNDPSIFPVTKPMSKINALLQASGEAAYVYDTSIDDQHDLDGAFILSSLANCRIDSIDTSAALKMPGVIQIFLAKDIPGVNSFMPAPSLETLFAYDNVDYVGQPVGLVIAQTYSQAMAAAKMVNIKYKEIKKPILTIQEAIAASSYFPSPPDFKYGDAETAIKNAPVKINGNLSLGPQFHFYLENQIAITTPTEDGVDVSASTQYLDLVQRVISQALNLTSSKINVRVKQLGGAYGGKITRANITAVASALASYFLNKKVRVMLDLGTTLEMIGKRFPWYAEYELGVDTNGALLGQKVVLYTDCGNSPNDNSLAVASQFIDNAYSCKNYLISFKLVKTNLPANTACRSPGTFPCIAISESMLEHVAKTLNADPLSVRRLNLYNQNDVTPAGQPLPYFNVSYLMDELIKSSDYEARLNEIQQFNQANRWKKRGISLTPIKWGAGWNGACYNVILSIYAIDGSVSLFHGGVEVGQGIHTKVAAVCAYKLGIPMETISVKYADNLTNPNSQATGGSITSEIVSQAVIECCNILNSSLAPLKQQNPGIKWPDLIALAYQQGVDLTAHYWVYPNDKTPFHYNVYGTCVSEALIDVLTGEIQIPRVDILYDCGQSLNGEIDIGQAQGAFLMGMGFWILEKIKYDPDTGKLLTNGTWEYKPPMSKDIPIDFRITFLKNNPNVNGVLGSRCIGEPPLCLTPSVAFAVKHAIEAARAEIKNNDFFPFNSPTTVETVQQLCSLDVNQFVLN